MPIIDLLIVLAIVISMIVGVIRGLVKEAISITALLAAIWAALYFGPSVGDISESWLGSEEMQTWFGRILVFAIVLSIGGLLSWGLSKIVRMSVLSGLDRLLGAGFGAARGVLLVAIAVLAGEFLGFDNDEWWLRSRLLPYMESVTEWIKVMAPQGYDIITPDDTAGPIPIGVTSAGEIIFKSKD